jgi:hypothetical protein
VIVSAYTTEGSDRYCIYDVSCEASQTIGNVRMDE